jgi:hypothetical protein
MYCPKCRAEYKDNILRCADCDVELVSELPPEEFVEFVKVFESADPALTAIIKSILDSAGIRYFVTGDNMQSILGAKFEFGMGADLGNAEFQVSEDDEETVRELLHELPEKAEEE